MQRETYITVYNCSSSRHDNLEKKCVKYISFQDAINTFVSIVANAAVTDRQG